ncbi:hypothetical protein ACFLTL_01630 [Chloroflexota bacterium]
MPSKNKRRWLLAGVLAGLLLMPVACSQATALTPMPTLTPPTLTPKPNPERALLDVLVTNCTAEGFASDKIGLPVGSQAVNFTLKDVKDNEMSLSRLLDEKPVLLIFGSFT